MESSDFLTILGLALAVWTIIPDKERRFILLFFSKTEIFIFIVSLFFIHFLISFDWIVNNWLPSLSIFTFKYGIPSTSWAYALSLGVITYSVAKVSTGYFSRSRLDDLLNLYETLIKEGELDILANYINKYHIDDIQNFLKAKSHLPQKDNIDIILRRKTSVDRSYAKLVKPKRIKFASWVYGRILLNEFFIRSAANKYPELFARAIAGMETSKASNESFVKLYIELLFDCKNQSLIQELKVVNDSNDSILKRSEQVDIPIVFSLFAHTSAASANYVWYPVGEGTVKSLKHDSEQVEFLRKKYDSDLESDLWNQKIYIATVYFNYMVRETIYRDSKWHMWLFYFRNFTDLLIEIIPDENDYNGDAEYPSFVHFIISEQFSIMIGWLELAKEEETKNRVIDTIRCMGWCINSICQAGTNKISAKFQRRQLDYILTLYFRFSNYPNNVAITTVREWLEKLFIHPKGVDNGRQELTQGYINALTDAWSHFDKVPYEDFEDNGSIMRFEDRVLKPLGIG